MKNLLLGLLLVLLVFNLKAQTSYEAFEGTISFVTSQNVYVKFQSTERIVVGDTLFLTQNNSKIPVLVVKELSSISCVCISISSKELSVGEKLSTQLKLKQPDKIDVVTVKPVVTAQTAKTDTSSLKKELPKELKQSISGRVSVSSYSNFSSVADFSQRMRYSFSLNAMNIGGSKLSGETYISFVHKMNEWSEVKSNIFNGLKIYSLALNYAFNPTNSIWIGRKINPKLSNMGAVDGIQYETKIKKFTAGIVAGTRPDYMNYSFNAKLLQYGAYVGHDYANKKGFMQTSLAFVEQTNNGNTDRRFAYLQHTNSLLGNLSFFGSVEFDMFNMVKVDTTLTQDNKPSLSNLYVSLRYKVMKQLSFSLSYSNRQNIIYYETYKNIIEQLLDASTTQGYMFQVSVHPVKNISIGANAGYRFSKPDPRPTKNLYTYVTFSKVPWINSSATLSATLMETAYLSGQIYSAGLSRDVLPGKIYGGIGYRYVSYKFQNSETPLVQNMAEMNLTWRMMKKLSCSLNYEGTFEKGRNYDRIYVNLTQRF